MRRLILRNIGTCLLAAGLFTPFVQANSFDLVTGEFPPFVGESVPNGGAATEIVTAVFSVLGYETTVSFLPWKRGFAEALNGDFLGTYPYSMNEGRKQLWYFSDALYRLDERFFSLKETAFKYGEPLDLKGKTVCKPAGYNLFGLEVFVDADLIKLERPDTMDSCFLMLVAGRVDLVLTNETTARSIIAQRTPDAEIIFEGVPYKEISHHLIVPKTWEGAQSLLDEFNQVIAQWTKSGHIQSILSRHVQSSQ